MAYNLDAIAERIRSSMKELGLKQKDIVQTTGVSKSSVSKWLGAKARPSGKFLRRLSEVLEISEDWILHGEDYCSYDNYNDDPSLQDDVYLANYNGIDIPHRDIMIKELGLDPNVKYSKSYLIDLYEEWKWDAFLKYQKEQKELYELSDEQEAEMQEMYDQELFEIGEEDKCENFQSLHKLEELLLDKDIHSFEYTGHNLRTPLEISRIARADITKTLYFIQEDESMEPIIKRSAQCAVDISNTTLVDGKLYLIKLGESYTIRAIFKQVAGGLLLSCENDRFHDEILSYDELTDLIILGRVYAWTNIDTI